MRLIFAGDYVNRSGKPFDLDAVLREMLRSADYSFCNFEGPIVPVAAKPLPKAGPHLNQPSDALDALVGVGFNGVTLANNHIGDYGALGISQTITELERCGYLRVGAGLSRAEACTELKLESSTEQVAIIAGGEAQFGCLDDPLDRGWGYAWINDPWIDDRIVSLKRDGYVVLVVAHAGLEDETLPLPEWRERYARFCRLGADVVIGHHPHVVQGIERIGTGTIFYSLGNLFFDSAIESDHAVSCLADIRISRQEVTECNRIFFRSDAHTRELTALETAEGAAAARSLDEALGKDYEDRIHALCRRHFEEIYLDYFLRAADGNRNFRPRRFLRQLLGVRESMTADQRLLLEHNARIESHRFAIQRGLKSIRADESSE